VSRALGHRYETIAAVRAKQLASVEYRIRGVEVRNEGPDTRVRVERMRSNQIVDRKAIFGTR
jgi:hypothetical protein